MQEALAGRLLVGGDMSEAEMRALAGGRAAVYSAHHPEREGPNQDAAGLIELGPRRAVLVVADGLGGLAGGATASQLAVQELQKSLGRCEAGDGSVRGAVLDGFEQANGALLADGAAGATTLAAAEIADDSLRTYHVGDSEILVVGQRGKVKLRTVSHSPVGYAVESGMLDAREAMDHDERHVVSNTVGDSEMRIEVGSRLRLAPRDTVLLGTDGLFDNVTHAEIVETIRAGSLDRAAAHLAELCRTRMLEPRAGLPSKPDDVTFILFRRT